MDFKLRPDDDYIKLGQLLKAVGFADTGAESKQMILDGEVMQNGEVVLQRGKKLHEGDEIVFRGQVIRIIR